MQSKEKITTDARTFKEIWESLTPDDQEELRIDIFKARCCTTRQAIYYWATGKKAPSHPLIRTNVAKVVGNFIGKKVFPATLFPA